MQKLLYADLSGDTLADTLASAGSNWSWPTLIQGTKLKLGFRLVEDVEGEYVEIDREVISIRAKIGDLYAQPSSGTYRLHIGPIEDEPVEGMNLTAEIPIGASAEVMQAALNATEIVGTTYGAATVVAEDGSYFATFAGETDPVPIRGANIRTDVISFIRLWASEMDGVWTIEIRPDKAGLAFADQVIPELPAAPVVSKHRVGVDNVDGTGINEIQKITFNPRFRGIYEIHWNDGVTGLLNRDDGPDQVGEALAAIAVEDGEFIVTNPAPNIGMVEFAGSMGAQPQDDLEIVVVDSPPADRYVVLDLGTKSAADFLRQAELDDADEIDLPLEVEIRYEDPEDDSRALIWLYQTTVTVRRRLTREGEATVNDTDYTRPVNARSYRPFNASQVAAGVHFYPFELGDGVNAEHTVDHGLGTLLVDVDLRENQPGGAFLVEGIDYSVAYDDEGPGEDAVVITLLGAYAAAPAGSLIGVVVGREQVSHFEQDTTWEQGQIVGFLEWKALVNARLAALELQAGSGPAFALPVKGSGSLSRPLGTVWRVPRARILPERPESLVEWRAAAELLGESPRRPLRLLPAVHVASTPTLPSTLPAVASARGKVYLAASDRTDINGVRAGDYVACDGREFYKVIQAADTTSYYPAAFETLLFETAINPLEFPNRSTLELRFGLEMVVTMLEKRALERRSVCQWTILLEAGVPSADTAPATPGENLDAAFTSGVTLLRQRLILTEIPTQHLFGMRIVRAGDGSMTARAIAYGRDEATTAPPSVPFILRARMVEFDTENSPTDAKGVVAVRGLDVGLDGAPDSALGRLTIS